MDQEPDVTTEDPEAIRLQMSDTRASLAEKLETLEEQVRETVVNARTTVEDTVESVRSSVEDTVQTVKHTFDVNYQFDHHPWAMMGASVLAGFVAGRFLGQENVAVGPGEPQLHAGLRRDGLAAAATPSLQQAAGTSERPGFLNSLLHQFEGEIEQLKGMAVVALAGVATDLIKDALPASLHEELGGVIESAASKLAGRGASEASGQR